MLHLTINTNFGAKLWRLVLMYVDYKSQIVEYHIIQPVMHVYKLS